MHTFSMIRTRDVLPVVLVPYAAHLTRVMLFSRERRLKLSSRRCLFFLEVLSHDLVMLFIDSGAIFDQSFLVVTPGLLAYEQCIAPRDSIIVTESRKRLLNSLVVVLLSEDVEALIVLRLLLLPDMTVPAKVSVIEPALFQVLPPCED